MPPKVKKDKKDKKKKKAKKCVTWKHVSLLALTRAPQGGGF